MKYTLLIYDEEVTFDRMTPKERQEAVAAFGAFTENLKKAGAYLGGNRLAPISSATSIRSQGATVQVVDGPFAETKEQLGGYYLIEAPDLDAALKWARLCPGVRFGTVEVRPVVEAPSSP